VARRTKSDKLKDHLFRPKRQKGFQKGHKKMGGRAKGTPNRVPGELKAEILEAFKELGGKDWLIRMAKSSAATRRSVIQLFGKMIPVASGPGNTPDENAAAIRERLKQIKEAGG
jgi:hypothetical protein